MLLVSMTIKLYKREKFRTIKREEGNENQQREDKFYYHITHSFYKMPQCY